MSLPFRSRVEHASVPILNRLGALPRAVVFLGILALFIASIFMGRWAWVPLMFIAGLIGWFLYLTWPRLSLPERLLRTAVLVLVVAVAIIRAFPR